MNQRNRSKELNDTRPTILVVDSNKLMLDFLEEVLELIGDFRVLSCQSGSEALERCCEEPPELVLLEFVLADMEGKELCKQLKAVEGMNKVPVVALTMIHREDSANFPKVLDSDVAAYIHKPFAFMDLKELVESFLFPLEEGPGGMEGQAMTIFPRASA